ncbi:MAG: glycosyltransferase [Planctomycetaceae bacterium]|nr:glycosyltransferase [Planctomycetaceae bacterium]
MNLAIIIPVYNEQENLPELTRRLTAACETMEGIDWRVIFVNDGSTDESWRMLGESHAADARFCVVDLSRNFGHQAAISAGMMHADADAVVVMDADLQDPPEVIPDLVAAWREGAQIVLAERRTRQERGLRRVGFELFHRLFKWISDFPVAPRTGVFGLLNRQAAEAFRSLPETNRFFPGLRSWIGFDQRIVHYDRADRAAGRPKQTLRRLVRYASDGIFSFSHKPLHLMTGAGVLISGFGFVLGMVFLVKRLLGVEQAQMGFTTLIVVVTFIGGIQLMSLGLLGQYLSRVYDEVKRRPIYIVRQRLGVPGSAESQTTEESAGP